jgi:hypothetical protein
MPSHYTTNDFFYMSLMEYVEKREFDTFNMKPDLSKEQVEEILKKTRNGEEFTPWENPWAYEMNRLIKKAHGQVWQFNAVSKDLDGYVRQVVCLGENKMRRWSWFDAFVVLPVLEATAKLLNKLRSHKVAKELEDWQKFLDRTFKKTP